MKKLLFRKPSFFVIIQVRLGYLPILRFVIHLYTFAVVTHLVATFIYIRGLYNN